MAAGSRTLALVASPSGRVRARPGHATPRSDPFRGSELSDIVDTLGDTLGAPVLVTTPDLVVVSHARRFAAQLDLATRNWIVDGTAPLDRRRSWQQATASRPRPTSGGWTVLPVWSECTLLGGLWIPTEVLSCAAEITQAAVRRAAALLSRSTEPAPQHQQTQALVQALNTGGDAGELAISLDLGDGATIRLIAFEPVQGSCTVAGLVEHIALRLESATVPYIVAAHEERVWALVPATADSGALVDRVLHGVGSSQRPPLRATIGQELGAGDDVGDHVHLISMLRRQEAASEILRVEDCQPALVLAEIAEQAKRMPWLREGAIDRLAEIDIRSRTQYLRTLRAYFDCGYDLQRTATTLHIHRNTLRYRLERLRELGDLDLSHPTERLIAELQLRLHDLAAA